MSGSCWLMQAICRLLDAKTQLLLASMHRKWPPAWLIIGLWKGQLDQLGVYVEPLPPFTKHRKIIGIQVSTAKESYNFPVFFSASDWGLSRA